MLEDYYHSLHDEAIDAVVRVVKLIGIVYKIGRCNCWSFGFSWMIRHSHGFVKLKVIFHGQ